MPDFGDYDFKAIRERFLDVNAARLARVRDALPSRQRDFLDLVPLLFHVNHPSLPGYASNQTPYGIAGYAPEREVLEVAQRHTRSFQYGRAPRRNQIHGLFIMGSAGTIAFSERSDFDFWLCHDPELGEAELDLLRSKAERVEEWADGLGLEVHFFLVNADAFRLGQGEDLSSESSGSAQHLLLLEEFYRTSLWLAGRQPAWWLVPPEHEGEYADFVDTLLTKRFVNEEEIIDFGGLSAIPAEEFFGAAVWQLTKGIESPYKSALKLLLTEIYAAEYPDVRLLALDYKRRVHAGETDIDALDAYVMLYERIEAYLGDQDSRQRLEHARRALYFKLDEAMSRPASNPALYWKRDHIGAFMNKWGWGDPHIRLLDGRPQWKIDRVASERKTVIEALTRSYQTLSDFARRQEGGAAISKRDLNILGRKLFTAFERKASKIDLINRGVSDDVHEDKLTVHEVRGRDGGSLWALFRGHVDPREVVEATPLKRARSLTELLAWAHFNRVVDEYTLVGIYRLGYQVPTEEVTAVLKALRRHFPDGASKAGIDDLARPAVITGSALFVNTGVAEDEQPGDAMFRGNASFDVLNYGGVNNNMVAALDMVLTNSWGEVYCYHYRGTKGLIDALHQYLQWNPGPGATPPPPMAGYCFSSNLATPIAQRMERLFTRVAETFYGPECAERARFVLPVRGQFFLFELESGSPRHQHFERYADLLKSLAAPRAEFSPVVIDGSALDKTSLPMVYAENKPGVVQLFYRERKFNQADVYVLDERGSLFVQSMAFHTSEALISHFTRFFESVFKRMNSLVADEQSGLTPDPVVEYYRLAAEVTGKPYLEAVRPMERSAEKHWFDLQAIAETVEENQAIFTLYCNDREFSSLEYGRNLFPEVARHVKSLRASGGSYPIYLTDIDLSRSLLGEEAAGNVQTLHFLNYKRRIEALLNDALTKLG